MKLVNGRLAQLGEHLPYKQGVAGSSPVASTKLYIVLFRGSLMPPLKKQVALIDGKFAIVYHSMGV